VDRQVEPVEPPPAQDVRHRLAAAAALEQRPAGGQLRLVERPVEVRVELDARQPERVPDQELGIEPRRRAPVLGEVPGREPQHLAELPHPDAAAASFRRRSSAASASEKSPRSPPKTRFRSWTVSPMRWSVTRSCGKL